MRSTSYYWAEELSGEYLDELIHKLETEYTLKPGKILVEGGNTNSKIRSTSVSFVSAQDFPEIWDLGQAYITEANCKSYNFDLTRIGDCQFAVYNSDTSDFYDWHVDYLATCEVQNRKVTMVVQLSDPKDYDGGDLEFKFLNEHLKEGSEVLKQRGTVITFPSFIPHRVTPVTKGIRKSLVFWMEGPAFR